MEKRHNRERERFHRRKEECWAAAAPLSGRDPTRWRSDISGHPVLKWLHSCTGPVCFNYDMRVRDKCQVVQSHDFYRLKGDDASTYSASVKMSDLEMDMIERGVYGNVKKPEA